MVVGPGGERSYSTVAFTLAVGEFVGQPWRATDEFDVFMDPVARTISMASLFEFARHSPHLQLILITPQDVSAVEQAKVAPPLPSTTPGCDHSPPCLLMSFSLIRRCTTQPTGLRHHVFMALSSANSRSSSLWWLGVLLQACTTLAFVRDAFEPATNTENQAGIMDGVCRRWCTKMTASRSPKTLCA